MLKTILMTLLLLVSSKGFTDTLKDNLYKASLLYDQGNYAEASKIYEKLVGEKVDLPGLYYNLGNSYYKSSRRGEAIAAYLKAYMMEPSDPDIKANLSYAMKDNKDQLPLPSFSGLKAKLYYPILESSTLERYWYSVISLAFLFFFLVVAFLLARSSKLWFSLSLLAFLSSLYFASSIFSLDRSKTQVAALVADCSVYSEPNKIGSVVLFSLHTGSPMKVLKKSNSFSKIELFDGKQGWIEDAKMKIF